MVSFVTDYWLIVSKTGASKDLEIYENYAKETDLRLQTELLELLVEAGILEPRDLASPTFRPNLTCAIKKLNAMSRNTTTSDEQEARTKWCHKAAMIEEQLIVTGYTSATQARMCPDFRHLYRELRDSCLLSGRSSRSSHNRDRNTFFSCVWIVTDARGRYSGGSLDQEPFRICSRCGDKVLPLATRTHIRHTKTGPDHTAFLNERLMVSCERQLSNRIIAVPRGLCASLVTMQEHCGDTLAHRISKWMLISFLDSPSQRELLQTSSLIARRPLVQKEGGGRNDDADGSWVVPVLRFWNRDGLPITDDESSGGGLWSSSLVMRPAANTKLAKKLREPVLIAFDSNIWSPITRGRRERWS